MSSYNTWYSWCWLYSWMTIIHLHAAQFSRPWSPQVKLFEPFTEDVSIRLKWIKTGLCGNHVSSVTILLNSFWDKRLKGHQRTGLLRFSFKCWHTKTIIREHFALCWRLNALGPFPICMRAQLTLNFLILPWWSFLRWQSRGHDILCSMRFQTFLQLYTWKLCARALLWIVIHFVLWWLILSCEFWICLVMNYLFCLLWLLSSKMPGNHQLSQFRWRPRPTFTFVVDIYTNCKLNIPRR